MSRISDRMAELRAEDSKMFLGLSRKQVNEYRITRALRAGPLEGLEKEVHQQLERNCSAYGKPDGNLIPYDVLFNQVGQRDLNVMTYGQGGAFVATEVEGPVIELLRNRTVCLRLGATRLDGLTSNVSIPRQTSPATLTALPEVGTTAESTETLDSIMLTPHKVSGAVVYSKQLLIQSSISVENFVRSDLLAQVAIKWDKLMLEGSGAGSEPTGILNTLGVGSLTFGGAATWASMLQFENALSLANADFGKLAYATTPNTRKKLKAAPKVTGATPYPIFIWETPGASGGNSDGQINSYRAACTNQISNDSMYFGNWSDLVLATFGNGLDILVNPYAYDTSAKVRIVIHSWMDVAIRHAASFCVSSDSAAQ